MLLIEFFVPIEINNGFSSLVMQLEAIRANVAIQAKEMETGGREQLVKHSPPTVTLANLKHAFDNLVPSISDKEKKRYQAMYVRSCMINCKY